MANADSNKYEAAAAALAGLGGTAAGASVADSDAANRLIARWLTRHGRRIRGTDFRVPVYASADYDLTHGSGEAVMASRISKMLNRHGIGSYYVNTQGPISTHDITSGSINGNGWLSDYVKRNARLWAEDAKIDGSDLAKLRKISITDPIGKETNALAFILKQFKSAKVPESDALRILKSGKLNGFTPGELIDTFKTIGSKGVADIASGSMVIRPRSDLVSAFSDKKLPHLLTGESGMNYNSLAGNENAGRVAQNTYPYPQSPRTRNVSLDTQFQANYRAGTDKLIPGSGMHDPGFMRRSRLARAYKYYAPKILGGGERSQYLKAIRRIAAENGIDPSTLTSKTKYMLISTGAAGANAAEKLRLAEKAFKNDPNVRIILQYGKKNPASAAAGLDMYTNNGVMDEIRRINKERPGFVMAFDRDPAYSILARNVDLHGAYGGSSSITEALANTNPTVAMTDTHLNRGNNDYGTSRRGIKQVDSGRTALGRLVREGVDNGTVINSRDGRMTLGQAVDAYGLHGLNAKDFDKIERDSIHNMRDAMYRGKGKFNKDSVRAANSMLSEQTARNKNFINTVRNVVLRAIDRDDTSRYINMRPGVAKVLSKLNRRMFSTAAGRRIGAPLAILSALGIGGGTYALSRKGKKS